jgi:RNA polymerase sigma-70 factor (ECF subfamily)
MSSAAPSRRRGPSLAAAIADDLDGAFEDLVAAYQDRLFAYATSLCGDPARAEEIVQDAFLRAYRALRRYPSQRRRELALRPWLYRITLNAVRNHLRAQRLTTVPMVQAHDLEGPSAAEPEGAALRDGQSRQLQAALLRLPLPHRQAIVLRYVHQLTYPEVAQVLGQPVGTVKANVHRGLQRLRRYVSSEVT